MSLSRRPLPPLSGSPLLPIIKPRPFCGADEFLLFVDQFDCQFTHEAELRPMSLDEAVCECEDTTISIIRMDQSNWRGEDVSDDVATEWLNIHEPDAEAESTLPDFVRNSEAWLDYLDDYDAQNGVKAIDEQLDDFDLGVGRYAS
jgi:hypothetical protein